MEDKSVTNVEENRIIASSLCYRYPEAEKNAVDEVSSRLFSVPKMLFAAAVWTARSESHECE